jgi:DNA polymerase-4
MVGDQTYRLLRSMGVEKVKTVQEMPIEMMDRVLGKNGISLWKKAQGIDNAPVEPWSERKSISLERTFEQDTTDLVKLKSIIRAMAENLAYQLRNGNKLTACVSVKVRYSDFQTHSRQLRISYTSADHTLIETVMQLFEQLYDRRVLVRLVGVRLSNLVSGGQQIDMFGDSEETIKLYQAMDKMRDRYGQDAVKRAVGMDSKGIGRANPFNGQPPVIPAHRRA